MAVNKENYRYSYIQPRGDVGALTLYRVDLEEMRVASETYENLEVAQKTILKKTKTAGILTVVTA
jgi:hypothetical protein